MPVVAQPNIIEGVCARLLGRAEITGLVGSRVSKTYQRSWNQVADKRAIVIGRAGSGIGDIPGAGIATQRLEVRCYGSNPAEAMEVWRMLDPVIAPNWRATVPGADITNAWVAGGVRCYGIENEAKPQDAVDGDVDLPFILSFYSAAYAETPAS